MKHAAQNDTRGRWFRAFPLLTLLGSPLLADFKPQHWLYRQRVTATATPVTRVTLDRAVYDGADASFADLRVVHEAGGRLSEVPYLLSVAEAARRTVAVPLRLVNKETRGGVLVATLELETRLPEREPHNEIILAVTRDNFRSEVTLEASDDGRQWATVRRSAYLFLFRTEEGSEAQHLTLRYPDSRRRYLRLSLAAWPDAAQFIGASVLRNHSSEARRSEIWAGENPSALTRDRTSCAVLDTGTRAPRDLALLITAAGSPATFHRSVTVEHSADGRVWSWLGAGAIYRIPGEESLTVAFPETRLPFERLCIFQGDDQPVRLAGVRFQGIDRTVSFRSDAPGEYWLYYGAPSAAAPVYDLARTAGEEFGVNALAAGSLSPRAANPAYVAPPAPVKPWTERFPGLLYALLGVAVIGLGWTSIRLLRPTAGQR